MANWTFCPSASHGSALGFFEASSKYSADPNWIRTRLAFGYFCTEESIHRLSFLKKFFPATKLVCCEYSSNRSRLFAGLPALVVGTPPMPPLNDLLDCA